MSQPGNAIEILTQDRDEWKVRCLAAEALMVKRCLAAEAARPIERCGGGSDYFGCKTPVDLTVKPEELSGGIRCLECGIAFCRTCAILHFRDSTTNEHEKEYRRNQIETRVLTTERNESDAAFHIVNDELEKLRAAAGRLVAICLDDCDDWTEPYRSHLMELKALLPKRAAWRRKYEPSL